MTSRFNPPPGWPPAPAGWTPPPGWSPDPSWPSPPPGWQLWVEDGADGGPAGASDDVSRFSKPDAQSAPTSVMPTYQAPGAPQPGAVPPSGSVPTAPPAPWSAQGSAPSWQQGPSGPGGPGAGGPDGSGPSRSGGKQWLIPVIIAIVAIGAIIAVLFATGVLGGSDDPEPKPTTSSTAAETEDPTDEPTTDDATDEPTDEPTTDDATDEPTVEPTDEASAPVTGDGGSRTSPLAPGETAPLGEWTTSFAATNTDAWTEISASGEVSDYYAPTDGNSFLMAPVTVTFLGEGSEPLYMLEYVFVSADGVTYKDKCGYAPLPNELDTGQELYTDASVTGNVCITVPTDKIDGGVWRMSGWDRVNKDTEAYFGLK